MNDSILRVAFRHLEAGWAGSGFNGTLQAPVTSPGEGVKIAHSGGTLHGWDRYIQVVAEEYQKSPKRTPKGEESYRALTEHILKMDKRIRSRIQVEYVDRDPYETSDEMRERVRDTGVLEVSTLFNQSEAFEPDVNLMLRAIHDWLAHLGGNAAKKNRGFDFKGEMQAYNKHLSLVGRQAHAAGAMFTEIVGQVCYFWYFGQFPGQKVITLDRFNWAKLGEVRGMRIIDRDLV